MREGWTETGLGDIAEVLDRLRKPISGAEREKRIGDVPYYGATGLAGWIDKPIFDEELVLLGEDAIDFLNPNVHKAYLISGPSWVNNHAHVLRAKKEKVLSFFLMEALNGVDYSQFVAFGTRSKLTQGAMMGISVRVPPLAEQKRIVDVVASVDAYIDALQQQSDTARAARNAVLHELLSAGGDDWTETTLGELCELYQPETISKAQMDDTAPYIVYGANGPVGRYSRFNHEEPEVVVTCRGATCGVVNMTPPNCWITGNAMVVKPRDNRATKGFLFWALQTSVDVQATVSGSAQPQITRTGLEPSRILVPPLVEQKQIVEIVSSMNDVIQSTEQAVANAKNLRSGLLSDLLSGEHEIPASYDSLVGAA